MGTRRGLLIEEFPVGTRVRIKSLPELERFKAEWKLHHPIQDFQLAFAGKVDRVKDVGFYFGGDELYTLEDIPGTWHECCLEISTD